MVSGTGASRSNQLRGIETDLAKEMVSREYETRGGTAKIRVEPKSNYKNRTGKSPDLADSAFVLVDLCVSRLGLMGGERFTVSEKRRSSWSDKMKQLDIVHQTPTLVLITMYNGACTGDVLMAQ